MNGQFLGQLTILANDRNQRVLDAQPRIPTLLWGGLVFGGVVLVALTGFMRLNHRVAHIILSSAVAVLLGLLLFIVYWLDHPFGTPPHVEICTRVVKFAKLRPWCRFRRRGRAVTTAPR